MGPVIRRWIVFAAFIALLAAWGGVVGAYVLTDSIAAFTIAVTIAALATEGFIWCCAIIGGWSAFANRERLWRKLTRRGGQSLCAAFVFLAVFGVVAWQGEARAGEVYTGMTLIDPATETRIERGWLLVEHGRIAGFGAGEGPDGDHVRHDMSGLYMLPGFIDAHAHITAGPHAIETSEDGVRVTMESVDAVTRFHARIALAFGVTTVRNPGADPAASAAYDARIASGEWIGPDAVHAGAVISPPPMGGAAFAYPRGEAAWMAEAERQAALGMRYFKLYHPLTEEELALGVRAAHAHGLEAIAHLDAVSWTRAAELGVDGLLHALPTSADLLEPPAREAYLAERGPDSRFMYLWFEYADFDGPVFSELVETLIAEEVVVDLTLLVNAMTISPDPLADFLPESERRYYHPDSLAASMQFLALSATGWSPDDYQRAERAWPKVLEFARRLNEAGVAMMIGTDSTGGGPAFARELGFHADAGLPVWEVLRLATSDAAEHLHMADRTGRIAQGLEADLVFLTADPLTDVRHAHDVAHIVSNGELYSHDVLARPPGD